VNQLRAVLLLALVACSSAGKPPPSQPSPAAASPAPPSVEAEAAPPAPAEPAGSPAPDAPPAAASGPASAEPDAAAHEPAAQEPAAPEPAPLPASAAAISGGKKQSCAQRVSNLSLRFAAHRSFAAVRADAPPKLAAELDELSAAADAPARIGGYTRALRVAFKGCKQAEDVFTGVAAVDGGDQAEYIRTQMPPAFEACRCKASPEHAGGLLEAVLANGQ
jgi:hypothetical protein